jgi:hypothetical protein
MLYIKTVIVAFVVGIHIGLQDYYLRKCIQISEIEDLGGGAAGLHVEFYNRTHGQWGQYVARLSRISFGYGT